ncbi:hypothetical protein VT84_38025 [Gemmata sp. SH-PL17]|uniref:helix-turn-helix domain-containing protein n=1 Tax=Gemmata sp. SH-PL17 TaxID=1630693 RepID=UPI00078BF053|nr:helix-turn-helix domain-containing protein [Gemmata sp. SH-PL17]AMV30253.1 hypothetical protein VT84_38025 [Gemmata sp. SH-PL17]
MSTRTSKKPKPPAIKSAPDVNGAVAVTSEVMTLAEAAMWLRVSESGLKADTIAGRVPARFVAGEWRFNKAALVAWLSQPELPSNRPKTGAELVERIREINQRSGFKETPEEAEAFIAKMYAARKADSAGA